VPALDGAVALAEEEDVAVRVGEHLRLDVARVLEVALDVDRVVGEIRLAFSPRRLECTLRLVRVAYDLETLAASAGGGLDRERPAELFPQAHQLTGGLERLRRARHDRHACVAHSLARRDLRAHRLD